jgi:hypothetical protein
MVVADNGSTVLDEHGHLGRGGAGGGPGQAGPEGLGMDFPNRESARAWVDAEVAAGKDRALCESRVRIVTLRARNPITPLRPCGAFWG